MVPVLEDNVLAQRWAEGTYNVDSLLAYSADVASPPSSGRNRLPRVFYRSPAASQATARILEIRG